VVSVHLVNDPRQAAMLAAPLRQRILEALDEPGSASTMARTLGLARQKVAYHVRQLEEHGFVELVREEKRRGCTERIVRRTAQYLVASPSVLAPGMDPRKLKDKFSSSYLIALASRMAQEVGEAQAIAEKAGKPLPTLSTDVEIRLRSPQDREAFAEELLEAIARLASKYHDDVHPGGLTYRLVVGAHPIRASDELGGRRVLSPPCPRAPAEVTNERPKGATLLCEAPRGAELSRNSASANNPTKRKP
jgi:DNA-binding transcriptional ArsR family regulator